MRYILCIKRQQILDIFQNFRISKFFEIWFFKKSKNHVFLNHFLKQFSYFHYSLWIYIMDMILQFFFSRSINSWKCAVFQQNASYIWWFCGSNFSCLHHKYEFFCFFSKKKLLKSKKTEIEKMIYCYRFRGG